MQQFVGPKLGLYIERHYQSATIVGISPCFAFIVLSYGLLPHLFFWRRLVDDSSLRSVFLKSYTKLFVSMEVFE